MPKRGVGMRAFYASDELVPHLDNFASVDEDAVHPIIQGPAEVWEQAAAVAFTSLWLHMQSLTDVEE